MKKSDIEVSKKEIKLEDILSLDIPQIMILFFLSVLKAETVRYTLLQDLNKYFFKQCNKIFIFYIHIKIQN